MAAGNHGVDHHSVAERNSANAFADTFDFSREFVTDHPRIDSEWIGAVKDVNVGSAYAGTMHAHDDFVASGLGGRIGLDGEDFRLTDNNARHMIT